MHIYDKSGIKYSDEFLRLASFATRSGTVKASYFSSEYPELLQDRGVVQKFSGGSSYHRITYDKIDRMKALKAVRQATYDSLIAKALIDRFVDLVVDDGLLLNLTPDSLVLGISDEASSELAEFANRRFHLWASTKDVSVDRTRTLYQLSRFVCLLQQRDNDYFVRFHYNKASRVNPLSLSIIDPTYIYGSHDESGNVSEDIVDGIQYDNDGREIAYYITVIKGHKTNRLRIPAVDRKSGLPFIVHGFTTEFSYQKRGLPLLYNALQECEQLQTFTIAQIESAIKQSSIAMYIKPTSADATNPYAAITAMRAGIRDMADVTETKDDFISALSYQEMGEVNLVPGSVGVFNLKKGEDLKGLELTSPTEQFSSFTKAFISQLAISRSMPYEVLMMQFNSNYSASRAALILAYRVSKIWQMELAFDFLDIVKEAWMYGEIAAGRLSMPGFSDPVLRAAWMSCNWIGTPMPDIDPVRSIEASKIAASIGATTLDRIARDRNGSSYMGNSAQLVREFAKLPQAPWLATKRNTAEYEDKDSE